MSREEHSSFLELLNNGKDTISELDINEIFQEINRLSDNKDDDRPLDEILKEAQTLIEKQQNVFVKPTTPFSSLSCESTPHEMRTLGLIDQIDLFEEEQEDHLEILPEEEENRLLNNNVPRKIESDSTCPSSPELNITNMKTKKLKTAGTRKATSSLPRKKMSKDKSPEKEENKENDNKIQKPSKIIKDHAIPDKIFCDRSTNPSPTHSMVSSASLSFAKEREIEVLLEKLKDTEERFQSLKIQHDSLSQVHRILRENHSQLQEDTDKLKIDVQHLNECANVLRSELQSARSDRDAAIDIQKVLQTELDESRNERKKFQEMNERDAKTIQDLQRQCREMERILLKKHPDSISSLIVASKISNNNNNQDSSATRKVLEARIAQLEKDAKEQDKKAQNILANVQSRFTAVQSKYETHIQDLETQVLSLQEINSKLNEKLFEQSKELLMKNTSQISSCTQTVDMEMPVRETIKNRTIGIQTDAKETKTTSSNTNPNSGSKSSSANSSIRKPGSRIPNSHSDSMIHPKDDHLLATLRGMRVELAIKEKAAQRMTRELEESKKTIKKLQKERDVHLKTPEKINFAPPKKAYDPSHYAEAINNNNLDELNEAKEKLKIMEMDLKALCDKRVQDLKCLQNAHEREVAVFQETIRVLQERLEERESRESLISKDKRKSHGPIDYYALKAKVSSLERRHSERENRLHLLIQALSKGKMSNGLHGTSDDLPEFDSLSPSCSSPVNKNL